MKHLTILVPDGENNLSSIVGAYKIFTRANAYRKGNGKKEVFKIELAGLSKKVIFPVGLLCEATYTHTRYFKNHLIIIPPYITISKQFKGTALIDWIEKHYKWCGSSSICTGAFLLASAGLLTEKLVLPLGFGERLKNFPKLSTH